MNVVSMKPPLSPAARRAFAIVSIQAIACELREISSDLYKSNGFEREDIKADVTRLGTLVRKLEETIRVMPRDM